MAPTRIRKLIVAGAAVVVSACTAGAPSERAPPATPSATPPAAATATAAPQVARQPDPARTSVREPVRAAPQPVPPPETLIGMAPEAVDKLLGKPELVRREGAAEVRLYRDADTQCTLHVFLYSGAGSGGTSTVEFFEARNGGGRLAGADAAACYQAVVKQATS